MENFAGFCDGEPGRLISGGAGAMDNPDFCRIGLSISRRKCSGLSGAILSVIIWCIEYMNRASAPPVRMTIFPFEG